MTSVYKEGIQRVTMTRADRAELGQLIRKREKVMRAEASKRSAKMVAEFEAQIASIHSFDSDETWAKAMEMAKRAATEAAQIIAARCEEMGIPKEFAPELNVHWYSRGQNASNERRAELRRVAKTKIEALEAEAISRIELISLNAPNRTVVDRPHIGSRAAIPGVSRFHRRAHALTRYFRGQGDRRCSPCQ